MERDDLCHMWRKEFKVAVEHDTWGQKEEAKETYERLAQKIRITNDENKLRFTASEKGLLNKLASALTLRAAEVKDDVDHGVGSRGMQKLVPVFDRVLVQQDPQPPFPLDLPGAALSVLAESTSVATRSADKTDFEGGSLLPPPVLQKRGDEALGIYIEKFGFKDATIFIDPFITISVVDRESGLMESQQDTPPSNRNKPNYVLFGQTVHIQTPVNHMSHGSAIVFEFKHFKPKKKKVSTKAWAFMEVDEFRDNHGAKLSLEIYQKPTDFNRKKLKLLSVKPLYLHVELTSRVN
mmetsp:Transcript_10028/g.20934  ORF Transcript_10028/g.20934 Transcript_10028/m.20934 type:complete len:294 (-) Transcript_10028:93-974(-)|eukprot:CAMPEP_0118923422 /NCGR_PEP_ID=MMETSP1169-20130426/1957_1 /TAXON_ID=36882 /ORGANISM="Pyramimonas obovata, Strain CCMP722" /LENGTH=293 /DNA_ID=CAMNT_0006864403 /DNA_START=143 /DNA_END=1024 /DNA_ORIENTATION=+